MMARHLHLAARSFLLLALLATEASFLDGAAVLLKTRNQIHRREGSFLKDHFDVATRLGTASPSALLAYE